MKAFKLLAILILYLSYCSDGNSQRLTAGFYSGVNFSDIHGGSTSGKWKFKAGPTQGVFVDYSVNRFLGFRTGVKYYTLYYEHIPDHFPDPPVYYSFSSSLWPGPYYPVNREMDFSFISIPSQIRISVPSAVRLDFMAGIYNAFLIDHNVNYHSQEYKPGKTDLGFIYSLGWSFPLAERLEATINARYLAGRKKIDNYDFYWHGSTDLTFGVAWNGFLKPKAGKIQKTEGDSVSANLSIIYRGGINLSWNSCETYREKYSLYCGPSVGILADLKLGQVTSLRSGIIFDRTGFSLNDSSDLYYSYYVKDEAFYKVTTRTSNDYFTIPLLLQFRIGLKERFFINSGPYASLKINSRCNGTVFYDIESEGSFRRYKKVICDDIEGIIKDNELGWIFGAGINIPFLKRSGIEAGLQYRKGFGEVFGSSYLRGTGQMSDQGTIFENSSVSFHLGLRVPVFE